MGYIFYGFGILILLSCVVALIQFKKISFVKEWFIKFKELSGESPKSNDFRSKKDLNLHTNRNLLSGIELLWVLFGLLTNNWIIFLFLLITSIMLKVIFGKIQYTIIGKIISMIFLIFRIVIYLLLIINHYHLHMDLVSYLIIT
jgi:hypothetical protein